MANLDLQQLIVFYVCLMLGFTVHEWAHAFSAWKLGDNTAKNLGRVTLNPIKHMDPMGSVFLPLACILLTGGGFLFAYGKPVPIDLYSFEPKRRKRCDMIITLAGPGSNLVLAFLGAIIGGILCRFSPYIGQIALTFISVNITLAVFNLIPIPPLDGSRIFRYLVGMNDITFVLLARWGFLILIVLINIPPVTAAFIHFLRLAARPFIQLFVQIATL